MEDINKEIIEKVLKTDLSTLEKGILVHKIMLFDIKYLLD